MADMISWQVVEAVDNHLDTLVSPPYQDQPLAQDWARVTKLAEEFSEAWAELPSDATPQDISRMTAIIAGLGKAVQSLISATGQNPRKPADTAARERLLKELADTALTAVYAIQHLTKDINRTALIMAEQQDKHLRRLEEVPAQ